MDRSWLFLILVLALGGCSDRSRKPLAVSCNAWIGYTPFLYMHEAGWLTDRPVRIVPVVSLLESVKLMESGVVDAIGGTQQEFRHLRRTMTVTPQMLLDRSLGADAVFANRPANALDARGVDVYLEVGSVNELLLDLFVRKFDLNASNWRKVNKDQFDISRLPMQQTPTVIVTYEPYLEDVERNGYVQVASSNDPELFIVDMLIARQGVDPDAVALLRTLYARAVDVLLRDPRGYYERIKGYLDGQSYGDFTAGLAHVAWLHGTPEPAVLNALNAQDLPVEALRHAY